MGEGEGGPDISINRLIFAIFGRVDKVKIIASISLEQIYVCMCNMNTHILFST